MFHTNHPRPPPSIRSAAAPLLLLSLCLTACNRDGVKDEQDARRAFIGLETMIENAMDLAFDGFNAASSANIADQTRAGAISGAMTVGGQVDQGASENKGMRLWVALDDYADPVDVGQDDDQLIVTYATTDDHLPALDLSLRGIPDGTIAGTLAGAFDMRGDLEGEVALSVSFDGLMESDGEGGTTRVPNSTTITGRAQSDYGSFEVDFTR